MKKKLNVTIYKTGTDCSALLLQLIGNYNNGEAQISPRDLEGFFATRKCIYPNTTNSILIKGDVLNTYHVSEDQGKTYTMTLEWMEVYELSETEKEIEQELN